MDFFFSDLLSCLNGYRPEKLMQASRRRNVDIFLDAGLPSAMETLPMNSGMRICTVKRLSIKLT